MGSWSYVYRTQNGMINTGVDLQRKRLTDVTSTEFIGSVECNYITSHDLTSSEQYTHVITDGPALPLYRDESGEINYPLSPLRITHADINECAFKRYYTPFMLSALYDRLRPDASLLAQGFNIYTMILELTESVTIVSAGVEALAAFAAKGLATGASNTWLWANWGAIPLANDLVALIDLISNLNDRIQNWNNSVRDYKTVKSVDLGLHSKSPMDDYILTSMVGQYVDPHTISGRQNISTKAKLILSLHYKTRPISDALASKIWMDRIGLSHPLSGVWEGVPFSWLVDYFVNVGEFLQSLEPKVYLPYKASFIVESYYTSTSSQTTVSGNIENIRWLSDRGKEVSTSESVSVDYFDRQVHGESFDDYLINFYDLHKAENRSLRKVNMTLRHAINLCAFHRVRHS